MNFENRDVGNLAQKYFSTLCSEVGITCNQSTEDKEGWDFVIEFDEGLTSGLSLDEKPARLKAFIQVKGSDNELSNRSIKLRNWEKMVNDNNPFFIARIEYDNLTKPQRLYLVHVGEELIEKALSRLREISNENSFLLKTNSINYPRESRDLLNSLDGVELKKEIKKHIKGGMFNYTNWKSEIIKNIGREKLEIDFTFKVDKDKYKNPDEFIVDLSLGKLSNVEVLKGIKKESRFGIVKEFDLGSGFLNVESKPTGKCELVIKNLKTLKKCSLSLDYHFPAIDKSLINETNFKFLLKDEIIEIEMKLKSFNFNYEIPVERKDLNSYLFKNTFKFVEIFEDVKQNGGQLELEINVLESDKTFKVQLGDDYNVTNDFIEEISLIKNSVMVIDDLGLDLKMGEVLEYFYRNKDKFTLVSDLLKKKKNSLKIVYEPNSNSELENKKYVVSLVISGDLGKYIYAYSLYMKGVFKKNLIDRNKFEIVLITNDIGIITRELINKGDKKVMKKTLDTIKNDTHNYIERNFNEDFLDAGILQ